MSAKSNEKNVGPYFNTTFTKTIGLHPNQMNTKLYKNLKENIIKNFQSKCFGSYGYIYKIYKIVDKEGGLIIPENSLAPAMYKVKFQCKLCRPLRGSTIIFEVKAINTNLIYLINGPIHCVIFEGYDQINKKNFTFDERRNILIGHIDDNKGIKIAPGTFVKVKCVDIRIENGTKKITMLGILDSIATPEESERANIERELEDKLPHYDYDEYSSMDVVEDEFGGEENVDIDISDDKNTSDS
jgi:Mimiviridae putative DNA-directed RNA polymerase subunit Rpb7